MNPPRICFVYSDESPRGHQDAVAAFALQRQGLPFVAVDHAGSDHGYFDCLAALWSATKDRDLIIVEHDIVVRPSTIQIMAHCQQGSYCSWDYPISGGNTNGAGLGCVKFTQELIHDVPNLFAEVAAVVWPHSGDTRSWTRLDGRIHHVLQRKHAKTIHVHRPALWHRNAYGNSLNATTPPAGYKTLIKEATKRGLM